MTKETFCSYCLRPRRETGPLVASPLAAICRDCTANARRLFAEAGTAPDDINAPKTPWERLTDDELLQRIPEVAKAGHEVEEHLRGWVSGARERGISWARIGDSLGMTRQSAWERFNNQ